MDFADLVAAELSRARRAFGPLHSHHEGYAVILEELEEYWAEVRRREPDPDRLLAELVQVAAMCQRAAEEMGLIADARLPLFDGPTTGGGAGG